MAKKKKDLPVLALITIPQWKNNILQFMCWFLRIPGEAMVITIEHTDLVYDGKKYKWLD